MYLLRIRSVYAPHRDTFLRSKYGADTERIWLGLPFEYHSEAWLLFFFGEFVFLYLLPEFQWRHLHGLFKLPVEV